MPPSADPAVVEELFRLPLEGFTAGRNALAARLRAEGKPEEAAAVKALVKPSASAWAVNQVFWRDRPVLEALLSAGLRLVEAQRSGAAAEELREGVRQRREALQAALRRAEEALRSGGHGASPQVLRRVSSTLEALAAGGGAARPGTLVADLQAPGFEALAGLDPAPPAPPTRPEAPATLAIASAPPAADAARLAAEARSLRRRADEAVAALAEAQERLRGARRELEEARRRHERAEERVEQSERAVAEAQARLAQSVAADAADPAAGPSRG